MTHNDPDACAGPQTSHATPASKKGGKAELSAVLWATKNKRIPTAVNLLTKEPFKNKAAVECTLAE